MMKIKLSSIEFGEYQTKFVFLDQETKTNEPITENFKSCISYCENERLIGEKARLQYSINPSNTFNVHELLNLIRYPHYTKCMKSKQVDFFRDELRFVVKEKNESCKKTPVAIMADFFFEIKCYVVKKYNVQLKPIVVVVPLQDSSVTDSINEALLYAGFEPLQHFPEASASILSSGLTKSLIHSVLFLDFGHEALRILHLYVDEENELTLLRCQYSQFGGKALTRVLTNSSLNLFDLSKKNINEIKADLEVLCDNAKSTLTKGENIQICFDEENVSYKIHITADTWNYIVKEMWKDIHDALVDLKNNSDFDAIICKGTVMAEVINDITKIFPGNIILTLKSTAAAVGALLGTYDSLNSNSATFFEIP